MKYIITIQHKPWAENPFTAYADDEKGQYVTSEFGLTAEEAEQKLIKTLKIIPRQQPDIIKEIEIKEEDFMNMVNSIHTSNKEN